jgi:hypothetical protein
MADQACATRGLAYHGHDAPREAQKQSRPAEHPRIGIFSRVKRNRPSRCHATPPSLLPLFLSQAFSSLKPEWPGHRGNTAPRMEACPYLCGRPTPLGYCQLPSFDNDQDKTRQQHTFPNTTTTTTHLNNNGSTSQPTTQLNQPKHNPRLHHSNKPTRTITSRPHKPRLSERRGELQAPVSRPPQAQRYKIWCDLCRGLRQTLSETSTYLARLVWGGRQAWKEANYGRWLAS